MGASLTALIYFGTFLVIGVIAKRLLDRLMVKRDLDLARGAGAGRAKPWQASSLLAGDVAQRGMTATVDLLPREAARRPRVGSALGQLWEWAVLAAAAAPGFDRRTG